MRKALYLVAVAAAAAGLLAFVGAAGATGVNGTTISATKTATGSWDRTFHWTIDKSVSPAHQDLFVGDSSTLNYTVSVTKDGGTDAYSVAGEVCVTNGGSVSTENLAIDDEIEYKLPGPGTYSNLGAGQQVDVSAKPVLAPGESYCYPYSITFTPVANALYRNVAHVTITNHSAHLNEAFGPNPKADFSLPSTPTLHNDSVDVNDTNGQSWSTSTSNSWTYDKTVGCTSDDLGNTLTFDNTATIQQTGDSAGVEATVDCFGLNVSKTANTSFDRTYHWTIDKSADQSSLTLALNESFPVNYQVAVGLDSSNPSTDSNWAVAGTITVKNPAPIDATVNGVSDLVSGDIAGTVDCGTTTFPATLASGDTLTCSYTAALPDASDRTNTATATLQNTPDGTTDFSSDPVDVSFNGVNPHVIDGSVDVSDSLQGSLGTVTYGAAPVTFSYQQLVGPYATCGDRNVDNTASFTTSDTGATGSDSWRVAVHVPCAGGCTLTIGYWKTHSGYSNGKQADMVTPLLPVWLGTSGGSKSVQVTTSAQAVNLLSMSGDASNGVNKLYAQLLAAKLNIASGAGPSAVASTIAAADAFLANYNASSWSSLSKTQKNQVLNWASTLDGYNNGLIGPGHCSQ